MRLNGLGREVRRKRLFWELKAQAHDAMAELGRATGFKRNKYHSARGHEDDVNEGAVRVMRGLDGDELCGLEQRQLLEGIAWSHDVFQEADPVEKSGFTFRQRKRGSNEQRTADWLRDTLVALCDFWGRDTVSDKEIELAHTSVLWTTPAWSTTYGTMIQEQLHKALEEGTWESIPVSIAMGDLLMAGHKPHIFIATSDSLFIEEWPGIDLLLRDAYLGNTEVTVDQAKTILALMEDWDEKQKGFAAGRKKVFDYEISFFRPTVQEYLRLHCNRFDDSIYRAALRCQKRNNMEVDERAIDMGFQHVPFGKVPRVKNK